MNATTFEVSGDTDSRERTVHGTDTSAMMKGYVGWKLLISRVSAHIRK
jgi:hypothetical protein